MTRSECARAHTHIIARIVRMRAAPRSLVVILRIPRVLRIRVPARALRIRMPARALLIRMPARALRFRVPARALRIRVPARALRIRMGAQVRDGGRL